MIELTANVHVGITLRV